MDNQILLLFSDLECELAEIKLKQLNNLEESTLCIETIENYLSKTEIQLLDYNFSSKFTEIEFYKIHFPKFYKIYFYYKEIFTIENERLHKCLTIIHEIEFYSAYKKRLINRHYDDFIKLQYYKLSPLKMDKKLFLRKYYRWRRINLISTESDSYVSNSITRSIGKRLSTEEIINYLDFRINIISTSNQVDKSNLKWTGSKIFLIELIYSLYLVGHINNVKTELSELVVFFENQFNIELNNHNNFIQDLKLRKLNKTKFLDQLKEVLVEKFET